MSSQPGSGLPLPFPHADKVVHGVLYGVLGAGILWALKSSTRRDLAVAVGLASLYGITDEFHQSFVPGRTPDLVDWVADSAGALLGALCLGWVKLPGSQKGRPG